jgi:hypothetical protein
VRVLGRELRAGLVGHHSTIIILPREAIDPHPGTGQLLRYPAAIPRVGHRPLAVGLRIGAFRRIERVLPHRSIPAR